MAYSSNAGPLERVEFHTRKREEGFSASGFKEGFEGGMSGLLAYDRRQEGKWRGRLRREYKTRTKKNTTYHN